MQQWIDQTVGVAYISVGDHLEAFDEFLDAIDDLISRPEWRPGMPVVEDLRQCRWIPPPPAIRAWQVYVADRQERLGGCRWAVVSRGDNPVVASILDSAAEYAAPVGITLKHFTNMLKAHIWVKPSD